MYKRRTRRRRRSLPILPIFVFIIIIVVVGLIIGNNAFKPKKIANEAVTTKTTTSEVDETTSISTVETTSTETSAITTTKTAKTTVPKTTKAAVVTEVKGDWKLILVNSTHILPDDFSVKLSYVNSTYQADARIADIVKSMISAAKNDGVSLVICSAYRSVASQTRLFNNKVSYYKNQGYSDVNARAVSATIVAVPKTSEHHTGLALDIVTKSYTSLDSGFDKTTAFRWLSENAYKYGFINRYPKDKTDITKISYEPWHYRYVGTTAAKEIRDRKICLEEYLK